MAAYFKTTDKTRTYETHVGENTWINDCWREIDEVYCDGHELEQAIFITGRKVDKRSFTFINEEAKLIAANWK